MTKLLYRGQEQAYQDEGTDLLKRFREIKVTTSVADVGKTRNLCWEHRGLFRELMEAGVFEGVKRVLVCGSSNPGEIGALLFLAQDNRLDFSVTGVEVKRDSLLHSAMWIDSHFRDNKVVLIQGDMLNLSALRADNKLEPWDLMFDQGIGPLEMTLADLGFEKAKKLVGEYADNLNEGGRLVVPPYSSVPYFDYNSDKWKLLTEQLDGFLKSGECPFRKVVEVGKMTVYKKK